MNLRDGSHLSSYKFTCITLLITIKVSKSIRERMVTQARDDGVMLEVMYFNERLTATELSFAALQGSFTHITVSRYWQSGKKDNPDRKNFHLVDR